MSLVLDNIGLKAGQATRMRRMAKDATGIAATGRGLILP
jgi:hypothetical protein